MRSTSRLPELIQTRSCSRGMFCNWSVFDLHILTEFLPSMMINMQYFCYVDSTNPRDSWVFSGSPSRLDWLNMQMGLMPLVQSTAQHHASSLLRPLWEYAAYERDASKGLPLDMLRLCGIREDAANLQRNSYWQALQSLAPLMLVERCTNNLIKYLSCLAGLNKKFFAKAQVNDHRALLILAYWFGLMCAFPWVQPI